MPQPSSIQYLAFHPASGFSSSISFTMNSPESPHPIATGTRIGHVHLKVADLERALGFYCGVLGFSLTQRYGARFLPAGMTIQALTPGRAPGGCRPRRAQRASTTWPSSTPPAPTWPTPCGDSSPPTSASTEPPTTASARHCTSATPTKTASNSTGTAPPTNGPSTPTATWRCSPGDLIWRGCCGKHPNLSEAGRFS